MKNFLFFMPGYDGNALNRNYLNLVNKGVEPLFRVGNTWRPKKVGIQGLCVCFSHFFEKVCVCKHVQVKEQGYLVHYYRVMVKGMGCACIVKNQIGVPAY